MALYRGSNFWILPGVWAWAPIAVAPTGTTKDTKNRAFRV